MSAEAHSGPLVPSTATDAWNALSQALAERGPAPCETSSLPDAWWPERPSLLAPWELEALRACRSCPVTTECLSYALAADERHGVWGGLTASERAQQAVA